MATLPLYQAYPEGSNVPLEYIESVKKSKKCRLYRVKEKQLVLELEKQISKNEEIQKELSLQEEEIKQKSIQLDRQILDFHKSLHEIFQIIDSFKEERVLEELLALTVGNENQQYPVDNEPSKILLAEEHISSQSLSNTFKICLVPDPPIVPSKNPKRRISREISKSHSPLYVNFEHVDSLPTEFKKSVNKSMKCKLYREKVKEKKASLEKKNQEIIERVYKTQYSIQQLHSVNTKKELYLQSLSTLYSS